VRPARATPSCWWALGRADDAACTRWPTTWRSPDVDFFPPVVDDGVHVGAIAAQRALDVYAMAAGLFALAVAGAFARFPEVDRDRGLPRRRREASEAGGSWRAATRSWTRAK